MAAGCDVALLCRSWQHCSLDGGSLAVLRNAVSVVVFVIIVMSHPAATRPEDHDDSHDRTCTGRRRSLQAKLARPSLRLSTLRSGEPTLCISPGPELYIR